MYFDLLKIKKMDKQITLSSFMTEKNMLLPCDVDCVFFHHPCSDGMMAAAIATEFKPSVECFPLSHPVLDEKFDYKKCEGKNILFIDIAPSSVEMFQHLKAVTKNILILDHHLSFYENVASNLDADLKHHIVYNVVKSGATLAWNYFYNEFVRNTPTIVLYIEDRDLLLDNLPGAKEVTTAIYNRPLNIMTYQHFIRMGLLDEEGLYALKEEGLNILRQQSSIVQDAVSKSEMFSEEGHQIVYANLGVEYKLLINEVAEGCCQKFPICTIVAIITHENNITNFSLRCNASSDVNLAHFASNLKERKIVMGGGGHAKAAGVQRGGIVHRLTQ